jgi:hypothetical protein
MPTHINTTICEICGKDVQIGEHPFCPHGFGRGVNVIDDTLPGGARFMHNLGDTPVWVETKSELKQIMQDRGLVFAERATYNRQDKSPYATRTRLRPGQRDPFLQNAG